ncbi:sensor histidine kinase [Streptomyces sp. NPDC049936]|uniref:sensor histidine kinase n=1 Tax=Streptomyces sp. NPDC049936 TaxID=3365599 RepID=UPI00379B5BCC
MRRSQQRAEWAAVRWARLRIAVITAAIITVLITLVGLVADAVMAHAQNEQVWRELRYAASHGDPARPPVCAWLFAPGEQPLANAPQGFPLHRDLERVRRGEEAVERTLHRDGTTYRVRTQVREDGTVVQAVFDMRFQLADRTHLWFALGVAELVGLIAAIVTGTVLGRLSVAPLAEALARQRRFVADASHELRTPITRVYTRAQVLSRQAAAQDLPAAHQDGLTRLIGSVGRLGEVLDDMLLSASLTAGPARTAEHRPVDLAQLARSVAAEEAERAGDAGLTVTVDGPEPAVFVAGVETALRRAVGELLSNAVRHSPAGGVIEVTVMDRGAMVELTITDSGPGFRQAEAERLFERFHRSGDGSRYGLGLALLREVVRGHGGTVTAEGRPGLGARFAIRLPRCAAPPTTALGLPVRAGQA